jgi:hypothetical protein
MKKVFIILLLLKFSLITQAQSNNQYYQRLPKDYQLADANGKKGPFIESDFDNDGVKDLVTFLYKGKWQNAVLCVFLSSAQKSSNSFQYTDWPFMFNDLTFTNGVVSLFSDNGSMGIFGSIKMKYDRAQKRMVVLKYQDNAGGTSLVFDKGYFVK